MARVGCDGGGDGDLVMNILESQYEKPVGNCPLVGRQGFALVFDLFQTATELCSGKILGLLILQREEKAMHS